MSATLCARASRLADNNVFQSIKKEERDILEKYYKSRKKEFENNMNIYLEKQNLNFITLLTTK